ncbi:SirB2 family protein [Entomomonas sp. E2T0]|uniref:SirB2 family protein n=1 Tax=Entomomonas sp. E2T0 TaxID=2930213 RepID=UPI0022281816|nr:SirB2 family protein [Entomomonas sp. E2T0]UYZ82970.1 SirB2 family protein [Entomomonas sp. E2T0]
MQKIILHLHALTAVITISLFIARFVGLRVGAKFMQKKWVRIIPHLNDTCLLIFGITLVILTQQYPNLSNHFWLTEKLSFLVGYIVFGFMAIKGRTSAIRYIGFALALACFACIVYLVKTKIPF